MVQEIDRAIQRLRRDSGDDDEATTPRDWLARQGTEVVGPLCEQFTFERIFDQSDVASPSNYLYYLVSVLKTVSPRIGDTSACRPALQLYLELDDRQIQRQDTAYASSQRYLLELVKTIAPERLPDVMLGLVKDHDAYGQFVECLPELRTMVQTELAR